MGRLSVHSRMDAIDPIIKEKIIFKEDLRAVHRRIHVRWKKLNLLIEFLSLCQKSKFRLENMMSPICKD